MQINKAIRSLMKEKNISLISMAKAIGKQIVIDQKEA